MNKFSPEPGKVTSAPVSPSKKSIFIILASVLLAAVVLLVFFFNTQKTKASSSATFLKEGKDGTKEKPVSQVEKNSEIANGGTVDTVLYNQKLAHMINGDSSGRWPVKSPYPLAGAVFPFKRVIAFYGNLYSKNMGILGELPRAQMLAKLKGEIRKWQAVDKSVEVVPALHYIASTAQILPGKGNKYTQRMPFHQIDSVLSMAKEINALVFLDIQIGHSTLREEIPQLETYLRMPHVHLGIDPEFSMKTGHAPGKIVGSFDAADINYATSYLSKLVSVNNLPPKILVIHRFTQGMVTNYRNIATLPEVQIVMDMDGWGGAAKKINTYKQYIHKEPVQFTGFKIFYKNDTKSNGRLLTPEELLALKPQPVYIQYQ